jgi:high-affinity Fe2+/Pb2+ permease
MPFSELVRVTVAFGSTAPEGSTTTPESVAVVVAICALAQGVLLTSMANRNAIPPQYHKDVCLLLLIVLNAKPPSRNSPSIREPGEMFFMP